MKTHIQKKETAVLIILDGFGHREAQEHNAIAQSNTPNWDALISQPDRLSLLSCSGESVGLPEGQMGNSEVGHMHIGAGRLIDQDLTRINRCIDEDRLFENEVLIDLFDHVESTGGYLHFMGLLSKGGVHSHVDHLLALLKSAKERGLSQVCVHAFLDGRDTPPKSALEDLTLVQERMFSYGMCGIVSLSGRFYAMDRDNRWERVQKSYDNLTQRNSEFLYDSPQEALASAYDKGQTDEFVEPVRVKSIQGDSVCIEEKDAVLFFNFRSDRARQMTEAFTEVSFSKFEGSNRPRCKFATMTQYDRRKQTPALFMPQLVKNCLGDFLSQSKCRQLRLAETEKYAHVTFFMNCGVDAPFEGEERQLIPSPKVKTYDLKPEMSAYEVTEALVEAIKSHHYDAIICNYANGDMVGHTGKFDAACQAVECLDLCLGKIVDALDSHGGQCLITADHGNVEFMYDDDTHQVHTAHTTGDIPLVYYGKQPYVLKKEGGLIDVAPTFLEMLDLTPPKEMTGSVLLEI